jgi:ABC-2 type transport system ATP-binding protein
VGDHEARDARPRLGNRPAADPAQLARVGYLAQDAPVYAGLPVADHLRLGAHLNPGWDAEPARDRAGRLGLDPKQKAGTLSGGQRAQLALTLATAKRPELLILDEPVASLDPLARREFLQDLMETVGEDEVSVVLSSHLISDLERACDYVIVLVDSRVRVAGPVDELLATHHLLSGPRRDPASLPAGGTACGGSTGAAPDDNPLRAAARKLTAARIREPAGRAGRSRTRAPRCGTRFR